MKSCNVYFSLSVTVLSCRYEGEEQLVMILQNLTDKCQGK